jgi:DNA invertase Pin-like site-specific DNA recombinase
MEQKRAVIYTRTSTHQQQDNIQLDALTEMAQRSGYDLIEVIKDLGVSGGKQGNKRVGMKRLMNMVNRREIDVVMVYSVDRIGRQMSDVISLVEQLEEKGVGLIIHKQAIDSSTTMGKALVGFFALVAQMEKDFIGARVRDGITSARARGVKFGRPKMSAHTEQEIRELRGSGLGMNSIAKQLGVGNSQVQRVCKMM